MTSFSDSTVQYCSVLYTLDCTLDFNRLDLLLLYASFLQFATEAAITILRIDDMIKLFKEDTGPPEGYDH